MAITKIQSNAFPASIDLSNIDLTIGANEIVTANIADNNVTHAKLHTDMDLSGKTVTLPSIASLTVSGHSSTQTLSASSYITVGSLVVNDPGSNYYSYNNRIGGNVALVGNLDVYNGNILLDGPSGSDPKIEFHQPTNTGEGGVIVYNDGDEVFTIASRMATYGDINFAIGMNDGDPTDLSYSKMFIRANGTVGIGYTNPQNNLHIIGNSSFNGGSTGITIQTHDLPNAEASISLLSRNGSNDNKTVNIRNVSGTFRVDASSVYLPTGLPNNQPYNMAGVAVREISAPSQYATANYYWIRLAYLNGRIPWLVTLTNTGGNYSPGSCTFIIQRSWDNTAFYKTTLSKTGSQYFTEVRMQSNEAGGNYYLEAYGYIASGSGGHAGYLAVTPLYDQSVVCEIPVNVYAVNGSNLTYTSSNQVL